MEVLKKGTIEPILVAMRDRLENVTDLATLTAPLFNVLKKSDGSSAQADQAWITDVDFPMTAICMVDTTPAAFVGGETYKLYLRYTNGTEQPVLGPIYFRVEDD